MQPPREPRQINVRVDPSLWHRVRIASITEEISTRAFLERALLRELERVAKVKA